MAPGRRQGSRGPRARRRAPHHRRVADLADDPRPNGSEKLAGGELEYRVRVGDYRVNYSIHDAVLLVFVLRIGHRREVCR
ncbi:MAG: type II toxin-antitoxin system RelE/ParE family toxin [Myxococcales bacterium]|nr:type II toxin-antitoxin system RelE/ParE family toxin [Myxococcales bacterium]